MSILVFIIFGGIVGWIASMVTGDNGRMGIVGNIIVGVIGAFIGGFIANAVGGSGVSGFNIYSFLVAIGGAIILLWFVGLFGHPKE